MGQWAQIGLTYDNGDRTDSWCHSKTVVPEGVLSWHVYDLGVAEAGVKNAVVLAPNEVKKAAWEPGNNRYFCME
jgi:hypothetical protein